MPLGLSYMHKGELDAKPLFGTDAPRRSQIRAAAQLPCMTETETVHSHIPARCGKKGKHFRKQAFPNCGAPRCPEDQVIPPACFRRERQKWTPVKLLMSVQLLRKSMSGHSCDDPKVSLLPHPLR